MSAHRRTVILATALSVAEVTCAQQQEIAGEPECQGYDEAWSACPGQPECGLCQPVDCAFDTWGAWHYGGGCTGLRFRHRAIKVTNNECGKPCRGAKTMSEEQILDRCKVHETDCVPASWSQWTECSSHLDQATRTRQIEHQASAGGEPCAGSLSETKACGVGPRPVSCLWAAWEPWSICSTSCGTGQRTRGRHVLHEAAFGGPPCEDALRQLQDCMLRPCVVRDCHVTEWSQWTACQVLAAGQRYRHRTIIQEPSLDGRPCPSQLKMTEGCPQEGPVSCELTHWSPWSDCDKSCAGGQAYRERRISGDNHDGGDCSRSNLKELRACNTGACLRSTAEDCRLSAWVSWSACSAECGPGSKRRERTVAAPSSIVGKGCDGPLKELSACVVSRCDFVDCRWSDWYDWSACSVSCGGGEKRRARVVDQAPRNGGKLCFPEDKSQVFMCNTQSCKAGCIDGAWGQWMAWTSCSATCSSAFKMRRRDVEVAPNDCGKPALGLREEFAVCGELTPCVQDTDCQLSAWGDWSHCSCECFGIRERNRFIQVFASGHGKSCASSDLKVVEPCNPAPDQTASPRCGVQPRIDCLLSAWTEWDECSAECGGGQSKRKRKIITEPQAGGAPCLEELATTQPCNTAPCQPTDCQDCDWGEWSEWDDCQKCGGQTFRHRSIRRLPNKCGKPCEAHAAKEMSNCTQHCDAVRYCTWSAWSDATPCMESCSASTTLRTRAMTLQDRPLSAKYIFKGDDESKCTGTQLNVSSCPARGRCKTKCSPQDCLFGSWTAWQAPTCEGLCERTREVEQVSNECGAVCAGPTVETKTCEAMCDVTIDCLLGDWEAWTECANPGWGEQKYRRREIKQMPAHGGRACGGALREIGECDVVPATPCRFSTWTGWGPCSRTCGRGWRSRTRSVASSSADGGEQCQGSTTELDVCGDNTICPTAVVDCAFGDWELWSSCQGRGQRSRERPVASPATNGGRPCSGPLRETDTCRAAPIDCDASAWSEWSDCDRTCGNGQTRRHRKVSRFPENGGIECPSELMQTAGCHSQLCGARDCQVSGWSQWTRCSANCGVGSQMRQRQVQQLRTHGGAGADVPLAEARACHGLSSCGPIDCQWEDWLQWSACSCTCGGGQKTRARSIGQQPRNGGQPCPAHRKEEVLPCSMQACDEKICIDGRWAEWGSWGACSASCGGGIARRHRNVAEMANECGEVAQGKSYETKFCNSEVSCEPAQDCEFSAWSEWNECSSSCNGVKKRSRGIATYGRGSGAWCKGAVEETRPCNPGPDDRPPDGCGMGPPVACQFADWEDWSACSASCGGGQHESHRRIAWPASGGGRGCIGNLVQVGECASQLCLGPAAIDCKYSHWGEWGACSKCGGEKLRYRHILEYPSQDGKNCAEADLEQAAKCRRKCGSKHFCIWNSWEDWSTCSTSCGASGQRKRRRYLELSSDPGPDQLPSTAELMREYEALDAHTMALEAHRVEELSIAFGAGCMTLIAGVLGVRSVLLWSGRPPVSAMSHSRSVAFSRAATSDVDRHEYFTVLQEDSDSEFGRPFVNLGAWVGPTE